MQIYADICNRPMKISRSPQTCALGAAIFGAVVGGAYSSVRQAQRKHDRRQAGVLPPAEGRCGSLCRTVRAVRTLHDAFGTARHKQTLDHVMKDLIAIRNRVRKG